MGIVKGKNILIGISGGIAAYKIPFLIRILVKEGATVKVVMSEDAKKFVTPETLSVLSQNEVYHQFFNQSGIWNNHVHLGMWADVFLIAPATANTVAKMANGMCDNILLATYLSARCKTILSPAMDLDMYAHTSTKENLKILEKRGDIVIPAETGDLASGLKGEGRMPEAEQLFLFLQKYFENNKGFFFGKKVLISAGPTYEAIDPVRFIGNRSSGKMGIYLADELAKNGAEVFLVLGPSQFLPKQKNIEIIHVESAKEMFDACTALFKSVDLAILAAAVADFTPEIVSSQKIKKKENELELKLIKTQDILAALGKEKEKQILIGFALETTNLIEYAKEKLAKKNLDFIIANKVGDQTGFGSDTNEVVLIDKHNNLHKFELDKKENIATKIVAFLSERIFK